MKLFSKGAEEVRASEIELPAGFDILNKDLYICTITDSSAKLEIEIYANRGRGFKSFSQNKELINTISIIATDSNFSPIVRVGYAIEEQKLSKSTTGDILVLDVATTGAISPQNALAYASKILVEHFTPLVNINEAINQIKIMNEQVEQQKATTLATPIEDLNLSVRSYNCLKRRGIQTIQELSSMSKSEIEKIKNLGKKSLREIVKQLQAYGVAFKEE
jgi:DNA-directed RNA polymerase subunit alpha